MRRASDSNSRGDRVTVCAQATVRGIPALMGAIQRRSILADLTQVLSKCCHAHASRCSEISELMPGSAIPVPCPPDPS